MLFTDGSVNTLTKIGYGSYLSVFGLELSLDLLKQHIQVRRFENTSSTRLELQTLLWALKEVQPFECKVILYTDSQNIIGLQGRRNRLEQNNYYSKKNKRLNNYKLYQDFYKLTDQLDCSFIKVSGHMVSPQKDEIDRIFTLVDRASRNALRNNNQ